MVTRDGFPAPRRAYGPSRPFTTAFDSGAEYAESRELADDPSLASAPEPDDEPLGELEGRYEWIVGLMSSFTDERLVRWIIAFFTASMGVCATLEILFGFGATSTFALGVQVGSAAFAFAAALWWLITSWPRLHSAFAFVVLSDIGIAAANLSANMPPAYAVGKTAFFVVLGLFAGVFLDRWMLITHIALAGTAVTGIIGYNMLFQDVPPLGALVVWAPVMSLIIAVPALLYTFVRAVRLDQS
ncbi:hypothetical protein GCM10007304_08490 [Rhodococcoides trifolii]|uniref:Uncharacterized protein n=2 Tax=Rhodococcoides trifolii TaxID=908250 RepID=A0A917CUW3_9NOCA|nr:hypothetical protein GCM10007304_08490 [Rhodococcus trifolii]